MSNNPDNNRQIEPRSVIPEVLSPADSYFRQLMDVFKRLLDRASPQLIGLPEVTIGEETMSEEDKKEIDDFLESIKDDLKENAYAMLREELRAKIMKRGTPAINLIRNAIKKKKKAKVKRKTGCIFIQFGEGTADDPIDELLIATT